MTVKFSGHLLDVPCVLSAYQERSTPTFKRTLRQWHPLPLRRAQGSGAGGTHTNHLIPNVPVFPQCPADSPARHGKHTARHYKHADRPQEPFSSHPFIPQISPEHRLYARHGTGCYGEPKQSCSCTYGAHGPPQEHGRQEGSEGPTKVKLQLW